LFLCPEDYVEEAWPIVDPELKADAPVYEYGPNTWGTTEVDQKRLARRAESLRNRPIRIGDVFMKIEIFADADSVAWRAATRFAADAPTAVAERDRFIIAISGVIGVTNITQTI
jgi:hypothetical protein